MLLYQIFYPFYQNCGFPAPRSRKDKAGGAIMRNGTALCLIYPQTFTPFICTTLPMHMVSFAHSFAACLEYMCISGNGR